jgi:dihydropteroate synthase
MGVLNVTPDSFSDGGRFSATDSALAHAEQMAAEGADWIDVGAESTRPGSQRTSADEQLARLRPVLNVIRQRVRVVLSIDTTLASVAEAALDAGVDVVNDISAGRDDPGMLPLVARRAAPIILMHMQGEPATMQHAPVYRDVTAEVSQFLADRIEAARAAGIAAGHILVDPGIGFGKTDEHNLRLLHDLAVLARLGKPVVIGTSRKGFVGRTTGEPAASGRRFGTAATVAWAAANRTGVVRVHDVEPMAQVLRMIRAIQSVGL